MIEFGHYQELSWILERVNNVPKGVESGAGPGGGRGQRQTFVFSATLSLPRRSNEKAAKIRRRKNLTGQETIGESTFWPKILVFFLNSIKIHI